MKREIITLQLGQCGNQIGNKFWKIVAEEHGLNAKGEFRGDIIQQSNIDLYFQESNGLFSPRAILVDLENSVINQIKNQGNFYRKENCIVGESSAANCYAVGFTQDFGIQEEITEMLRKEVEYCGNLLHFQVVHAVAGGVSGYGMTLIQQCVENFSKSFQAYSVYPAESLSYSCTEAYNTLLCSANLLQNENVEAIYQFDNETLCRICTDILDNQNAHFDDFNRIIALFMTTLTSTLRFPSQISLRPTKILNMLKPEKIFKMFIPSIAPLQSQRIMTPKSLTQEIFSQKNYLCQHIANSKIISSALIYRGCHSSLAYEDELKQYVKRHEKRFIQYLPNNIVTGYCDLPLFQFSPQTIARVTISASTMTTFETIVKRGNDMYRSGFGVHWYSENDFGDEQFDAAIDVHMNLVDRWEEVCGTEKK